MSWTWISCILRTWQPFSVWRWWKFLLTLRKLDTGMFLQRTQCSGNRCEWGGQQAFLSSPRYSERGQETEDCLTVPPSQSLSLFFSPLISTSIYVYLSLSTILHQGGVQIKLANVPHSLIFPHHLLKWQQYSADRCICLLQQRWHKGLSTANSWQWKLLSVFKSDRSEKAKLTVAPR